MQIEERRTLEEAYADACTATNLKTEADKRGDADLLIAAGWNPVRVGAALMRLVSEWDGAEKPRRMHPEAVRQLAKTLELTVFDERQGIKNVHEKAMQLSREWHQHEMKLLFGKLKTMPAVREQVTHQARKWSTEQPDRAAAAVLLHWLDSVCHPCSGLKFLQIADTPSLSAKMCRACDGTGKSRVPYGDFGKRLENWMDRCVSESRINMSKVLRNSMGRV